MRKMRRILGPALLCAGVFALLIATTVDAQRPETADNRTDGGQAVPAKADVQDRVTPRQLENVEARMAITNEIVGRFEQEAKARGMSSGWRQSTIESLLSLSLPALESVRAQASSVGGLSAAIRGAAEDPSLIGDTDQDLLYFPITPCRYGDTRNAGGQINGIRGFDISFNGATYGGQAACNPTVLFGVGENQFGALALNLTIVNPVVAPGFAAVKPTAASPVTSLLNWYEAGPGVQAANLGIVTLDQTAAADEYVVQTSASVDVIQDIFGAFLSPHATALDVTTVTNSVFVAAGAAAVTLQVACPAGRTPTGGGCNFATFGSPLYFVSSNPLGATQWNCAVRNNSGAVGDTLTVYVRCGRIPGR